MSERRGAIPNQRERQKPKTNPDAEKTETPTVVRLVDLNGLSFLVPRSTVLRGNSVKVKPETVSVSHPQGDRKIHVQMLRITPVAKIPTAKDRGLSDDALHRARRNLKMQERAAILNNNGNSNHNGSHENGVWPNSAKARFRLVRERSVQAIYMEVGSRSKRRIPIMAGQPMHIEGGRSESEIEHLKEEMNYLSTLRGPRGHRRNSA